MKKSSLRTHSQISHNTVLNTALGTSLPVPSGSSVMPPAPAGEPVNTMRTVPTPRNELWPLSTSDTPFTDHSGEPLPAWPLHLPQHCKHDVNVSSIASTLNVLITHHLLALLVYLSVVVTKFSTFSQGESATSPFI